MHQALGALVLIMLLTACQPDKPAGPPSLAAAAAQTITVAYTAQPQGTLIHIGMAQGYFAAEGVNVRASMHEFGKTALQAVVDGDADIATVAETPIMFSILRGEKIAIVSEITNSSTNNAIIVRKDAGIASPAGLTGRRVGYTPGTTGEFFLDAVLSAGGHSIKEVKPVPLKPKEMLDALETGKVDAVSTWNYPLSEIQQQMGNHCQVFYDRDIYTETFALAGRKAFIASHEELMRRFLRALLKAEQYSREHPTESQQIVARATSTDITLVRKVWPAFKFNIVLNQSLLITLEDETRWAIKNKLVDATAMPDYLAHIHFDSLQAVKPEAVKIIH